MINQTRILQVFILSLGIFSFKCRAENIIIQDADYSFVGLPSSATSFVSIRFGTWNSVTSVFTQQISGADGNLGYASVAGDEMQINLSQTDNVIYSASTALALAVFTNGSADAGSLDFTPSNSAYRAIFTNANWVVGTLANNTDERIFPLDINTIAVVGGYNFNSGNQIITLIPEPSTGALMMIGAAGLVALRRLRKV